jgi:hypothetical protein
MDCRVGFLRMSVDEVACEGIVWSFFCIFHCYGRGSKLDFWVWLDLYFGVHDFYEFFRFQIPEHCTLEAYVGIDIGRRSYVSRETT